MVGELAQFFEGERRKGRAHHAELQRLNDVSKLVLGGAGSREVVEAVRAALVAELELRDARFDPGEPDGSRPVLGTDGLLGSSGVLVARRTGFEFPAVGSTSRSGTRAGRWVASSSNPSPAAAWTSTSRSSRYCSPVRRPPH